MANSRIIAIIILSTFLTSCDEGDTIDIPELNTRYVVESYLQPSEPPRLLITRTDEFIKDYDPPKQENENMTTGLVSGVKGHIYLNGQPHQIMNKDITIHGKYYNYQVKGIDSLRHNDILELKLEFPSGEKAYAKTFVPEYIPIDSVKFKKSDNRYGDLLYITFDKPESQYVRRQLLRVRGQYTQLIQDLPVSGSLSNNGHMVFGSEMDFRKKDTVISRVYSINKEYYDYYNSIFMNVQSNTNPFVQPGEITGNITGTNKVVGIFTAMQMADSVLVVQ